MADSFYSIRALLKKFDINITASTRNATLKNELGSEKDPLKVSGIYRISCGDCEKLYQSNEKAHHNAVPGAYKRSEKLRKEWSQHGKIGNSVAHN